MFPKVSQPKYVLVLACVAGAVLVIGSLLKPAKPASPPAMSESDLMRLQRSSQRRNLQNMSAYFSEAAAQVAPHLVRVKGGATGIVWDDNGTVATAAPREGLAQSTTVEAADGAEIHASVTAASPDLGLAAVRISEVFLEPAPRAPLDIIQPGAWVVQVSASRGGEPLFTPGIYSGALPGACGDFQFTEIQTSLPIGPAMEGSGLFNMNGALLGMILRCGDRYVAVAAPHVTHEIERSRALDRQVLRKFGVRLSELDEAARRYYQSEKGVLVREVWTGRSGDAAGMSPGDLVLEVNGAPVASRLDLRPLLDATEEAPSSLTVMRGKRKVQLTLPSPAASDVAPQPPVYGISLEPPRRGYVVENVAPGSPAEQAGIRPGDRILRIDGRELTTLASIRRVLSGQRQGPVHLVFERGRRELGAFLQ